MTFTRRDFFVATAGIGALCALSGCTHSENSSSKRGYADDTDVKDYPLHLSVYADANLQWIPSADPAYPDSLSRYVARYQEQSDRSDITIDVIYFEPDNLLTLVEGNLQEGDGILALDTTLRAGNEAESVDGGEGGYLIRDLSYNFPDRCVIVRATGSDAMLPAAETLDGEDSPDGTINRLQQLPAFEGIIALADPETTTEGVTADAILARQGFYSTEDGGIYDESIASKLRMYPTQDEAMEAVEGGTCQLGFALKSTVGSRFASIEQCYDPSGNAIAYSAAALACSEEPGVVRDFFAFIQQCTD